MTHVFFMCNSWPNNLLYLARSDVPPQPLGCRCAPSSRARLVPVFEAPSRGWEMLLTAPCCAAPRRVASRRIARFGFQARRALLGS